MPDLDLPSQIHPYLQSRKETDVGTGAANWPCQSGGKEPGWRFGYTMGFLVQIFGIFTALSQGF